MQTDAENKDLVQKKNTTFVLEWAGESIKGPCEKFPKSMEREVGLICSLRCFRKLSHYIQTHTQGCEHIVRLKNILWSMPSHTKNLYHKTDCYTHTVKTCVNHTYSIRTCINEHNSDSHSSSKMVSPVIHRHGPVFCPQYLIKVWLCVDQDLSACTDDRQPVSALTLSMSRHAAVWHNLLTHECESAPQKKKQKKKNRLTTNHISKNTETFSILLRYWEISKRFPRPNGVVLFVCAWLLFSDKNKYISWVTFGVQKLYNSFLAYNVMAVIINLISTHFFHSGEKNRDYNCKSKYSQDCLAVSHKQHTKQL